MTTLPMSRILLQLCAFILGFLWQISAAKNDAKRCDEHLHLANCLTSSTDFLKWYQKKIIKRQQTSDLCKKYIPVGDCLRLLLEHCSENAVVIYHVPIVKHFDCICNITSQSQSHSHRHTHDCQYDTSCIEKELASPFSRGCSDDYHLNIQQPNSNKCFFLQQAVYCRQVLISHSCNKRLGVLAAHITAASLRENDIQDKCITSIDHRNYQQHYTGLEYNDECTSTLITRMNNCTRQMEPIAFNEHNDLIVNSNRGKLKLVCKSYRRWKTCMQPLRNQCPLGVKKALDLEDGRARRYFLKLQYICRHKEYVINLKCYKKAVQGELQRVSQCFADVKSSLQPSNAFRFFCEPHNNWTLATKQQLVNLRQCYEKFYSSKCGEKAGKTIGGLIKEAFSDAHYLRMGYQPDCLLHQKSHQFQLITDEEILRDSLNVSFDGNFTGRIYDVTNLFPQINNESRVDSQNISGQYVENNQHVHLLNNHASDYYTNQTFRFAVNQSTRYVDTENDVLIAKDKIRFNETSVNNNEKYTEISISLSQTVHDRVVKPTVSYTPVTSRHLTVTPTNVTVTPVIPFSGDSSTSVTRAILLPILTQRIETTKETFKNVTKKPSIEPKLDNLRTRSKAHSRISLSPLLVLILVLVTQLYH